jgi:flagellar hook-length control protein FliK
MNCRAAVVGRPCRHRFHCRLIAYEEENTAMSVVELSQYNLPPLFESNAPDAGAAQSASGGLFGDYLQRAQTSSAGGGDSAASDKARDAGKTASSSPRTENANAKATQPARQKNNDGRANNDDDKKLVTGDNASTADRQPEANKDKPVDQATTNSSTDKKGKDEKKDKSDGNASPAADNSQNVQLQAVANAAGGTVQSDAELAGDSATISPEQSAAANLSGAVQDAKMQQAADSIAAAKAAATASQAAQDSAAEVSPPNDAVLAIFKPEKTTVGEIAAGKVDENPQQAAAQILGTSTAAANSVAVAGGAANGIGVDWRKLRSGSETTDGSSQTKSGEAAAQAAPSGVAAANVATMQAAGGNGQPAADNVAIATTAIKPPIMPTTPDKDKTDRGTNDKPADVSPGVKAADAASALQRGGQTGDSAAASQQSGDDAAASTSSARFVQRVEQAFAAMGDRGGSVRLMLSPPELGSLRMEISVSKGVMKAHLETETKEAKNLILDNLPALRERLAQQNIKIQTFDVDLRDPSSGGMPQHTADQSGGRSSEGARAQRVQSAEISAVAATGPRGETSYHDGQLNVIV